MGVDIMASIVHQQVKGTTYLYESIGYRDKNDGGKVKNKRTPIGKIDSASGEPIYKEDYIQRMKSAGTPVELSETQKLFCYYSANTPNPVSIRETGHVKKL
jgi:hypothetical protein